MSNQRYRAMSVSTGKIPAARNSGRIDPKNAVPRYSFWFGYKSKISDFGSSEIRSSRILERSPWYKRKARHYQTLRPQAQALEGCRV